MWRSRALRIVLGRGEAEFVIGDIREEFVRLAAARPLYARLWLWRQTLGLVLRRIRGRGETDPVETKPKPSRRGTPWDRWSRDLRHGARLAIRNPGVSLTVATTLGLGIGATVTMFSITRGILRELPFERPESIVAVSERDVERGLTQQQVSGARFVEFRRQQTTMVDLAAVSRRAFQVSGGTGRAVRYDGAAVSPWLFSLLGTTPAVGRDFNEGDIDGSTPPVVLISDRFWHDRFDGAPDVVGRTVQVDETARTVIGVMPDGFGFPTLERLWIPLALGQGGGPDAELTDAYTVVGRLRPNVSIEESQAEFALIGQRLTTMRSDSLRRTTVAVSPYRDVFIGGDAPALLYTMLAVVSSVLIIACANVTNVLTARALARQREMAVRTALGGTRAQVLSQLLTETLVVAIAGGVIGVVAAHAAVYWFNGTVGHRIERFWVDVSVDGTVLGFALGLVLAATLLAGLAPALQSSKLDVVSAIKHKGAASFRLGTISRVLIVGQVALSCALLLISGLMIKGVISLGAREVRFDQSSVMTARARLAPFDYPTPESMVEFARGLDQAWVAQSSGSPMAVTSALPGIDVGTNDVTFTDLMFDLDGVRPQAVVRSVTPQFFTVFEMSARGGRLLDGRDRHGASRAAVVNPEFVEQILEGADPIGRHVALAADDLFEIVGVVDDLGASVRDQRSAPGVYVAFAQRPTRDFAVALSMEGPADVAVPLMLGVFADVDRHLAVYEIAELHSVLDDQLLPQRTFGVLFGAFGVTGLALAMVGLYGVMTFVVRRRTQEIGLRRALGAGSAHVVGLTVRAAMMQIGVGIVLGTAVASFVAPAMGQLLFGADPRDPMIYGLVTVSLALTALVASLIPSMGAARVSPMIAFMAE